MARTIRFHLDENCDPRIAAGLRLHGVDVTTTPDAGLLHASDETQLAHAVAERRVIVTQDTDFLRIAADGLPAALCPQWMMASLTELLGMLSFAPFTMKAMTIHDPIHDSANRRKISNPTP
jgi:uncharacterized protein with PIN domain